MAFAPGERRVIENFQPLSEVGYLFLDRVIGAAFIPNWGFISNAARIDNSLLVFRSTVAITILILLISLCYFNIKNRLISVSKILLVTVSILAYWVIAGILINPEPRYAVAPGILILFFCAINLDRLCLPINHSHWQNLITYLFLALLVSTWIFSLTPSGNLRDSVGWNSQITKASVLCQGTIPSVKIVARPLNMTKSDEVNHALLLPCNSRQNEN
jgi:hypothetical protein